MSYRQNKIVDILLSLLLALAVSSSYAAGKKQSSKSETVDIKAHYVLLDEKKGLSKYKGDVIFTRNTLVIKADEIILYFINNELNKAFITGSPADVRHLPANEAPVHSQAKSMEFFIAEDRLVLKGSAFVDQGDRHFSGESIEYDTRQQTISASSNANNTINSNSKKNAPPEGRVHVIIGPGKDDTVDNDSKTREKQSP